MISPLLVGILLSMISATAIVLTNRRDRERTAGLSRLALVLLLILPVAAWLPKFPVLPAAPAHGVMESQTPWVAIGWLSISSILVLRLVILQTTLGRWRQGAEPMGQCRTPNGKVVPILESHHVAGPCAAGLLNPVIFVPTTWSSWPGKTRKLILAHELAHHARRDPLWRMLGSLTCAIHWFNPLAWWLAKRHALESEFACDAAVIASGIDPKTYSHALCDLASAAEPELAAAMSGSSLHERIRRLCRPSSGSAPVISFVALIIILATALTVAIGRRSPMNAQTPDATEVRIRLSADPFPANP